MCAMPLNPAQKQAQLLPCFAGARKPLGDYVTKLTLDTLHGLYVSLGAAPLKTCFRTLPEALRGRGACRNSQWTGTL